MARRNGAPGYTEVPKRGGNPNELVTRLYDDGRAVGFPRNAPPRPRHDPAVNDHVKRQGRVDGTEKDAVFNENTNQHPANWHDKNYNNDSGGYVRACRSGEPTCNNEDATTKPGFDKKNVWRGHELRDQIKDYDNADHRHHHSTYERRSNVGVTHDQMAHDYSQRHIPKYERHGELSGTHSDSNPKPRR
jgi:hypothetical protein